MHVWLCGEHQPRMRRQVVASGASHWNVVITDPSPGRGGTVCPLADELAVSRVDRFRPIRGCGRSFSSHQRFHRWLRPVAASAAGSSKVNLDCEAKALGLRATPALGNPWFILWFTGPIPIADRDLSRPKGKPPGDKGSPGGSHHRRSGSRAGVPARSLRNEFRHDRNHRSFR